MLQDANGQRLGASTSDGGIGFTLPELVEEASPVTTFVIQ